MTNYTTPQILPKDGDISKPWFVMFRWTMPNGKRKQIQFRGNINKYKTLTDKRREARSLLKTITSMLAEGWDPIEQESRPTSQYEGHTLYQLLWDFLDIKKNTLRPRSYQTYKDVVKIFTTWLEYTRSARIAPENFTTKQAREYADYLIQKKKFKGKSYNNQISFIRTMFNMMIDREVITKNPFAKIEKLREEVGKNHAFTESERNHLIASIKSADEQLYYFVSFMYHCFIRRTELTFLRIQDIDLKNRRIVTHSVFSKNGKQEGVSIPEGLVSVIEAMQLCQYPNNYYVFGKGLKPNAEQLTRPGTITERHKQHLLSLGISEEKTLYSWKHTGVCDYWNAIQDAYALMRQLRHHDLAQTTVYLKSLGLAPNEKILNTNLIL